MAHQSSTGLRNALVTAMATSLANGRIDIYTGAPPASADAAPTGTLLVRVSKNGDGSPLAMGGSPATGVVRKPVGDVWRGAVLETGVAGYYRYVVTTDTGLASPTECRMQGAVGEVDAELILSNVNLIQGSLQDIKDFAFAIPTY